ncbi:MAG: DUF6785 family protein [Kiritimatiellia bacterium]
MTRRAVILGLLGAILMGAGGQYALKYIPGLWMLIRGQLPVSVFGGVIVFVLLVNPVLGRLRPSFRLQPAEVAVIMALILVACGIAEAGMMRYFPRNLVLPLHQNRLMPSWQKANVLSYAPSVLLANGGQYSEEVVDNFIGPMGAPGQPIPITSVPWHAWWQPLLWWCGVIGLTMLAVVSLSVILHRQWAERERLRYPLAEIISTILRQDRNGRAVILGNRLFWLGFGPVLLIRVLNGIHLWFPRSIEIPLSFDFSALQARFPKFMEVTPGARALANPTIYPACVGLTFLLAAEIGFSLGIANLVSVAILYALISAGLDLSAEELAGNYLSWQSFGASLGLACMLIYAGRQYYWQTLKQALLFLPQPDTQITSVRACRCLLLALAGATVLLSYAGMSWLFAFCTLLLVLLLFLTVARLNVECGTFFYSPSWRLPVFFVGLFGLPVLGPTLVIILGMMMYLVEGDSFECLMPFAVNGLKITSDTGLRSGRVALWFAIAIVLIFVIAVPTALWADYNHAAAITRGGDGSHVFDTAVRVITQLKLSNRLEEVMSYGMLDRLRNMHPNPRFLAATAVGFGVLIILSLLRLRFPRWPLHPVILLVFGTRTASQFGASFFLGWFFKALVSRFGGAAKYEQAKGLMLGVIIGDLTGGFGLLVVNALYYAVTGLRGPTVTIW